MARAGLAADPAVEAPRALRPILRFRGRGALPGAALATVRRVVDEDDAFRARVAAAAATGERGPLERAGELFLGRPEGWEDDLAALVAASSASASAAADAASEAEARRRLAAASERAARAEAALGALRTDLAAARAGLAAEQRAREADSARTDELERRVRGLEAERDAAHRRSAGLANELDRLASAAPVAPPEAPAATTPEGPDADVVEAVRGAISEAAAASDVLQRALAEAADLLVPRSPSTMPAGAGSGPRPTVERRPAGRLPVTLPPGIFDDERAAAEHLVRVAGVVLVVDGYNASLRRWPDEPLAEQRRRLVDLVAGVAARRGCEVHVVFDGGDDQEGSTAVVPRRGVRVTFSPAGVEADDVILAEIDRLPAVRPVVVVTGDRRVQREAAARGANVVAPDRLFSLR